MPFCALTSVVRFMCGPRIALATLLLLALEVGAIRGQESERIRSELQSAYDRMAAAFANKDVAGSRLSTRPMLDSWIPKDLRAVWPGERQMSNA